MSAVNLVVLHGRVSSPPRVVELPSGSVLHQIELTTRGDEVATVPVAWFDPTDHLEEGAEVIVVGQVRRRFFRAGGVTASRTEVVAERVIRAGRRRTVAAALARAADALRAAG
ncbi:MAG: hypothetical protein MUE78_04320 [Ilumatobacteraceae bacterium]|nr:hypothetical protein [Ilumatobacteraceae bacterium]